MNLVLVSSLLQIGDLLEEVLPHVSDQSASLLVFVLEALYLGADLLHDFFLDCLPRRLPHPKLKYVFEHATGHLRHAGSDLLADPINDFLIFYGEH